MGQFKAARSPHKEQLFSSGNKKANPRHITLWIEPIITLALLARLHFDLGWPKGFIGTESSDMAFDAATYLSGDAQTEYVACEIKKTVRELDQLVERMVLLGNSPAVDKSKGKEKNAFKKVKALRARRPPLFWAVGPGGSNYAFKIRYAEDGVISFQETAIQELGYWAAR